MAEKNFEYIIPIYQSGKSQHGYLVLKSNG